MLDAIAAQYNIISNQLNILDSIKLENSKQEKNFEKSFLKIEKAYSSTLKKISNKTLDLHTKALMILVKSAYTRAIVIKNKNDLKILNQKYEEQLTFICDYNTLSLKNNNIKQHETLISNLIGNCTFCMVALFESSCKKNETSSTIIDLLIKKIQQPLSLKILHNFLSDIQINHEFLHCNLASTHELKKIIVKLKLYLNKESSCIELFNELSLAFFEKAFRLSQDIFKKSNQKTESTTQDNTLCVELAKLSLYINSDNSLTNLLLGYLIQQNIYKPEKAVDYFSYVEKAESNKTPLLSNQDIIQYTTLMALYEHALQNDPFPFKNSLHYLEKYITYIKKLNEIQKDYDNLYYNVILKYNAEVTKLDLLPALHFAKNLFIEQDINQAITDESNYFLIYFYALCMIRKNHDPENPFNILEYLIEDDTSLSLKLKDEKDELENDSLLHSKKVTSPKPAAAHNNSKTPLTYKYNSITAAANKSKFRSIEDTIQEDTRNIINPNKENLSKAVTFFRMHGSIDTLIKCPSSINFMLLGNHTNFPMDDLRLAKAFFSIVFVSYYKYSNDFNEELETLFNAKFAQFIFSLHATGSTDLLKDYLLIADSIVEKIFDKHSRPKLINKFLNIKNLEELSEFYYYLLKVNDIEKGMIKDEINELKNYDHGSRIVNQTTKNYFLKDKTNLTLFPTDTNTQIITLFNDNQEAILAKKSHTILLLLEKLKGLLSSNKVETHGQKLQIVKSNKTSFLTLLDSIKNTFTVDNISYTDVLALGKFYKTVSLSPTEPNIFYIQHWIHLVAITEKNFTFDAFMNLLPCLVHIPYKKEDSILLLNSFLSISTNTNALSVKNHSSVYFLYSLVILLNNSEEINSAKNTQQNEIAELMSDCILKISNEELENNPIKITQLHQCYWLLKDTIFNDNALAIKHKYGNLFTQSFEQKIKTSKKQTEMMNALQNYLGKDIIISQEHSFHRLLTVDGFIKIKNSESLNLPYDSIIIQFDGYNHFNSDLGDDTTITYKQKNKNHDDILIKMNSKVKIIHINIDEWEAATLESQMGIERLFVKVGLKEINGDSLAGLNMEIKRLLSLKN